MLYLTFLMELYFLCMCNLSKSHQNGTALSELNIRIGHASEIIQKVLQECMRT